MSLINSLSPGRCNNLNSVKFEHMSGIKFMRTYVEIALRWVSLNLTNGKSTFIKINGLVSSVIKSILEPMLTQM